MIARAGAMAVALAILNLGVAGFRDAGAMAAFRDPDGTTQSSVGRVAGTITLTAARRAPLATSAYTRRGIAPKAAPRGPETKNVVVFVADARPSSPPPAMRATIAQKDEQFLPAVTAVTVGSTIDFPNQDPFFHNVFSLSQAANFDLGRYPSGESKAETFRKAGTVKVFCHLHSQMSALIRVFDHPWFTVPNEAGAFSISGVRAGEHTVVAWHERIGESRQRVRITAGETVAVAFTLPVLEPTQ